MKPLLPFIFLLALPLFSPGQVDEISVAECYQKAMANYPLQKQKALMEQTTSLQVERINKERLPNISWNAQASLQSETVEFPFQLPLPGGEAALDLPLYRVQTTAELQYILYDGGINDARQEVEKAQLAASQQEVEVELEKLKSRANQYIFGILLQRDKVAILRNSQSTLEKKAETLQAALQHGAVLPADIDKIKVEILRLQSEIEQAEGNIRGLVSNLSALIGEKLSENVSFTFPEIPSITADMELQRPELKLFDYQKEGILAREALISASRRPRVGLFVQAGVGAPNPLNFFDESLSPFAMGGVNFSWKILDWGQQDRDRQLLTLRSQLVEVQRETFRHNINQLDGKYQEDIATLQKLIARDKEIARLQEQVLKQVSAQLQQGVATSTDYITQANALTQAQLNRQLHELQLQQVRIDYLTLKGQL